VAGTFRYSHADFSSIRGLSGIMSSLGKYSGTLDQIDVEGDTEMPDFALSIAGNPLPLTTHYIAMVDGTDGNTYLKSVEARLGNSPISVNGEIVGIPGVKGKHIVLDATSRDARTEDLIGLAVKGGAPLKGSITLHTKIDLPPPTPGTSGMSPSVCRCKANLASRARASPIPTCRANLTLSAVRAKGNRKMKTFKT